MDNDTEAVADQTEPDDLVRAARAAMRAIRDEQVPSRLVELAEALDATLRDREPH